MRQKTDSSEHQKRAGSTETSKEQKNNVETRKTNKTKTKSQSVRLSSGDSEGIVFLLIKPFTDPVGGGSDFLLLHSDFSFYIFFYFN